MHSTDSTGLDGESLDSDVEMYLKMAASDEVPASKKSKKNENAKMRSIQTTVMIGNQIPLVGNMIRSQVATGNKDDRNHNIANANVTSNLTPITTTTHRGICKPV